jgi:hypothetical protein
MKKINFIISTLILVATSSCVTSLRPLVTYNTAIADNRVEGAWEQEGQEYIVQKVFNSDFYKKNKKDLEKTSQLSEKNKRDSVLYSKSYIIKYSKEGLEYLLFGSMIKLNGRLFMNFTPADLNSTDSTKDVPEFNLANPITSHTIARVEFSNTNTMKLDFIDGDFLYKQINAGRMKIKHETDELYDTFLITASTRELQQFLEKYGNDSRFFSKENSVTLIRKS